MANEFVEIGKVIKRARMTAQLSQLELSKKMGLSASSINNFEKGVSKPQLVDAFRLEHILGLKDEAISQLVIGADYRAATGLAKPFPTHRGGTEKVGSSSVHSEKFEEVIDKVAEKVYSLNNGTERRKVMGEIIRVPLKLPRDIYLKLEFE